ncbi:MAG: hypothetical protein ACRD0P_08915 [Stackebrandtia sp.]
MDDNEFYDRTEALVEALLPRIPDELVPNFESMLIGGEFPMAVSELVATLVKRAIPISPAERDELRGLVQDMNDDVLLAKLEGLTVQAAAS